DTPLADATEALKLVRKRAGEWGIDSAKVGFMGFSAGGNLAALAGTRLAKEARPTFLALMYPGIPENFGEIPEDLAPTFVLAANDDKMGSESSLRFAQWARAKKLPVELHLFAKGGHGFGMGKKELPVSGWPMLFTAWLAASEPARNNQQ